MLTTSGCQQNNRKHIIRENGAVTDDIAVRERGIICNYYCRALHAIPTPPHNFPKHTANILCDKLRKNVILASPFANVQSFFLPSSVKPCN